MALVPTAVVRPAVPGVRVGRWPRGGRRPCSRGGRRPCSRGGRRPCV